MQKMKIKHDNKIHNGKNEKMTLNDRNTRCEEKKNMKKLKFNKRREDGGRI